MLNNIKYSICEHFIERAKKQIEKSDISSIKKALKYARLAILFKPKSKIVASELELRISYIIDVCEIYVLQEKAVS